MRRARDRRALSFSIIILAVACISIDCHARSPYARGVADDEIRSLGLRDLSGAVELRYEQEDNSQGADVNQKRTRFEERLDLRAQGSVYHPNLLQFDLGGSVGIAQESFGGNFSGGSDAFLYECDLNMSFFQQKPLNFSLFANQSSSTVGRQFFGPIKLESDMFGGSVRYNKPGYSATLLVMSQETREDAADFNRSRKEKSADLRFTNSPWDLFTNEFRFVYKEQAEKDISSQNITTNDITLYSHLDRGALHGASNISYLAASGLFDTSNLKVSENFQIDHNSSFTTLYNYNYSRFESNGFTSDSHQLAAALRHRLYQSLTSDLRFEGGLTDSTDFREIYFGPAASLSYVKKVPGGLFTGGYTFSFRSLDREADAGVVRVFNEPLTLTDGRRALLANPNVVVGSVVVKDALGVVLRDGIDYRLTPFGTLTEVLRVGLPNDSAVLVDYDYSSLRSLRYDTVSNGFTLRYDLLQMLSFYFSYLNSRQVNVSASGPSELSNALYNTRKSLYGVELNWRSLIIGGEYEEDKSDLTPFIAWRLRGSYNRAFGDNLFAGIGASHSETDYEKENDRLISSDINLNIMFRPFDRLFSNIEAGYLRQKGRGMETRAYRVRMEGGARIRAVELNLRTEYLRRKELRQERDEFLLKIALIRRFDFL